MGSLQISRTKSEFRLNARAIPVQDHLNSIQSNYDVEITSNGPISVTTHEREKEKFKQKIELISTHKIIKKINKILSIFCSPGHFISFNNLNKKEEIKLKKYLFRHQVKKKFQYCLEWEKNQLAIWDNRSMLHQATSFKGNRVMHRITIY